MPKYISNMYLTIGVCNTKTSPFFPHAASQLKTSKAKLKTYTGEVLTILDETNVSVDDKGQTSDQSLLVVAGNRPSLLGQY